MSDSKIVVIAKAKAGEGKLAETERQLNNLIEPTRAEDGCIMYELHRGEDSEDLFLFLRNMGKPFSLGSSSRHSSFQGICRQGRRVAWPGLPRFRSGKKSPETCKFELTWR